MVYVKFGSWDEEAKDLKARRRNSITRKIDKYNPVFKLLEDANLRMAKGVYNNIINIDGLDDCLVHERIKDISYNNGEVTISW